MKKCSKCHITKPYQEFGKVSKNKDGYKGKCKLCKREYDNKFHENRSPNKKLLKYYRQKERLVEIRKFLSDYLNDKVCNHCGDGRKVVLEFHHLRDKNFNLRRRKMRKLIIYVIFIAFWFKNIFLIIYITFFLNPTD